MTRFARFETPHAARYLEKLCRHFGRKVEVSVTAQAGRVLFEFGRCDLSADAHCLEMRASGTDANGIALVVQVVTSHLERYAFRENPVLEWQTLPD